jgi:hypothetical protein
LGKDVIEHFKNLREGHVEKTKKDYFSAILVTQAELEKNADNLFRLMATTEPDMVKIWSSVKDKDQLAKIQATWREFHVKNGIPKIDRKSVV